MRVCRFYFADVGVCVSVYVLSGVSCYFRLLYEYRIQVGFVSLCTLGIISEMHSYRYY